MRLTFENVRIKTKFFHGHFTKWIRYPCFTADEAGHFDAFELLKAWHDLDRTWSSPDYANSLPSEIVPTKKESTINSKVTDSLTSHSMLPNAWALLQMISDLVFGAKLCRSKFHVQWWGHLHRLRTSHPFPPSLSLVSFSRWADSYIKLCIFSYHFFALSSHVQLRTLCDNWTYLITPYFFATLCRYSHISAAGA